MRQLARRLRDGSLELVDVPDVAPGPGAVAVRLERSLISSGTERATIEVARKNLLQKARQRPDQVKQVLEMAKTEGVRSTVDAVRGRLDELGPLGYSAAGVVLEAGGEVRGIQPGDRVAIGGGGHASHAELAIVPQLLCARIPEGVGAEAAAFTTVGAIAMQGFRRAEVEVGSTVAVIGLGLVGQLAARIALAAGCRVIGIDLRQDLLDLAAEAGAEPLLRADADNPRFAGVADAVLLCAAAPQSDDPVKLAGALARDRAPVVVVGDVAMQLPRNPYYDKELDLRLSRSYGPGRYDDNYELGGQDYPLGYVRWTEQRNMESFLSHVASGRLDPTSLVSHRFAFDDAERAFAVLTGEVEGAAPPLGIVLEYEAPERATPPEQGERPSTAPPGGSHGRSTRATGTGGANPRFGIAGAGSFATRILIPGLIEAGLKPAAVASAGGLSAADARGRFSFDAAEPGATELKRGIPTYVEKPLALTTEELAEVRAAQERGGGAPLWVGFNRVYAPAAKALAGLPGPKLQDYRVNAGPLPPEHWTNDPARGGGRLLGEGCHFVDFLVAMAGSDPVSVSATGFSSSPDLALQSTDNFTLQIRFADGGAGTITYAADAPKGPGKEHFQLSAPGVFARIEDFSAASIWRGSNRTNIGSRTQDKGWDAQFAALAAALRKGEQDPAELDRFYVSSLTTLAAVRSLESGVPQPVF
jgi:threonine dehydrogenase-like Zn-dependent dehydrogenase